MSDNPKTAKIKTLKQALEICTEYDVLNENCYFDKKLEKFRARKSEGYSDMEQVVHMAHVFDDSIINLQKQCLIKALLNGHIACYAKEVPTHSKSRVVKIHSSQWKYLKLNVEDETAESQQQKFIDLLFQVEARLYGINADIKTGSISKVPIILEAYNSCSHEFHGRDVTQKQMVEIVQAKIQEAGVDISQRGFGESHIKKTLREHGKFTSLKEKEII